MFGLSQDNVTDNSVQMIIEALHNATSLVNSTEDQTTESLLIISDTIRKLADCSVSYNNSFLSILK